MKSLQRAPQIDENLLALAYLEIGPLAPQDEVGVSRLEDVTGKAEGEFALDESRRNYFSVPISLRSIEGTFVGMHASELARVAHEIDTINHALALCCAWRLDGTYVLLENEIRCRLILRAGGHDSDPPFDHKAFADIGNAVEARAEISRQLRLAPEQQDQERLQILQSRADRAGLPNDTLDEMVRHLSKADGVTACLPYGDGTEFRAPQFPRKEDLRPASPDAAERVREGIVLHVNPYSRLAVLASGHFVRIPDEQELSEIVANTVVRFISGPPERITLKVFEPACALETVREAVFPTSP